MSDMQDNDINEKYGKLSDSIIDNMLIAPLRAVTNHRGQPTAQPPTRRDPDGHKWVQSDVDSVECRRCGVGAGSSASDGPCGGEGY